MKNLLKQYDKKKKVIISRLKDFKKTPEKDYIYELFFCILTPQSNAQKCWQAVEEIKSKDILNKDKIARILRKKTRFYNKKTKYIMSALDNWKNLNLKNKNIPKLRNWLAENVQGIGLKEASHFLRNIGKSKNKIAILDRHILKNLKELKIIKNLKIKNKSDYLEKEKKFIKFSKKIQIPIDHLDLLFWSKENGNIFK